MMNSFFPLLLSVFITLGSGFQAGEMSSPSAAKILSGPPIRFPLSRAPAPELSSSRHPWRLTIKEGSLLIGTRGQRANIRIRLHNLEKGERSFRMDVSEDASSQSLLESQSRSDLKVAGGGAEVLTLNLRIPERISNGHRSLLRVKAVALDPALLFDRIVTPEDSNFVQMELLFRVFDSFTDSQRPRVANPSLPVDSQCSDVDNCSDKNWKAIYHINDDESGIRSIETEPFIGLNSGSQEFAHSPFVHGDPQEEIRFILSGNCCEKDLKIRVVDGIGNEEIIYLSPKAEESHGLSGVEIGLIVLAVLILLLLIVASVVIITIRRKRAANLEEIRRFNS